MKLIGNYLSPFARRVAVSLNVMGLAYEMDKIMVFEKPDAVSEHNPLVRIPTLVLDDGDALVESYAILDALDEMAGDEKRLTPAAGMSRRKVMKFSAVAVGTMDKAQWAAYEGRHRPEDKYHQPWADHNDAQAMGGLAYLDGLAEDAGDAGWLAGGDRIGQADISTVVAYSFTKKVRPHLDLAGECPALTAFVERCEALDAFSSAPVPG